MDDDALNEVPKFKNLGSIFTEDEKNKDGIIKGVKEAKVMFDNLKNCSVQIVLVGK